MSSEPGDLPRLEDILATDQLLRRETRQPNHAAENRALIELARAMAQSPETVLQKLTDLALALCGSDSAGVSIAEGDVFRWRATAGDLAKHIQATIPRHFSPCSLVLERDAVQLLIRPARFYPYIAEIGVPVHELLLIPFHRGDTPIGTVWVTNRDRKFDAEDARVLESLARFASAAAANLEAIDEAGRAANLLRGSEERYKKLFNSMDEGFCVIEMLYDGDQPTDYRYIEMNPAFEKQTGLKDAVGKRIRELLPDQEPYCFEIFGEVARTGVSARFVHEAKDLGKAFDVFASRVGPNKVAKLFNDITQRLRAEQELRKIDARKDAFLATLAHELRNPLGAISNALLLGEMPGENEELIQRQVGHLSRLIDDLLDVSRINEGKITLHKETLQLTSIARRSAELVRPTIVAKCHRLILEPVDPAIRFVADPTRVEQVLGNLLTNSAKYSEPGGTIRLAAEAEGDQVIFRVSDTGLGIAPEMLPKVFDLFTQVDSSLDKSQGGLGIGLTLVRNIVEMHGGTVEAFSEGKGKGSVFTVRLPIGEPAEDIAPPPPKAKGGTGRVLVVDDNLDTASITARLLKRSGFEVQTAHDGPEAISIAHSFLPRTILLDIGLPGMSGYEVASRLRKDDCCKDSLIIAVSGYGEEKAQAHARAAGFDHHMTKPVNFNDLLALITQG